MADTNEVYEYRLVVHKLSAPKCFIDYLHNFKYSFVWKAGHSVCTDEYAFDPKTCCINFAKCKLKLNLNQFTNDNDDDEDSKQHKANYTSTKLILCEQNVNKADNETVNLDEITLTTNYFVLNKKQLTNITFNKIIADEIRIELKLSVTLIAKRVKHMHYTPHPSMSMSVSGKRRSSDSLSTPVEHSEDSKEKEQVLQKWMTNMGKFERDRERDRDDNDQSSVCSEYSNKRRRSGLCANSVQTFYQKSKQIEQHNKEESKMMDAAIKSDYNEMGNQLMINMEEVKNLKSQIEVLQNLLFEKNVEIEQLTRINIDNKKKMEKLQDENVTMKKQCSTYKRQFNENKILMQTMKYQLQYRYSKYTQLLTVMKLNKKSKLKQYIAQLIVDNDDLEYEIQRISDSWRTTSGLLENYSKKKSKKLHKLKKLYHQTVRQNEALTNKLAKHGIVSKQNPHSVLRAHRGDEHGSGNEEDHEEEDAEDDEDEDEEMNELWNDIEDDAQYNDDQDSLPVHSESD